jgi:hypothetical protein
MNDSDKHVLRESEFQKDYRFFTKTNDNRFGDISVMQHMSSTKVYLIAKEKICRSLEECERNCYQAKERLKLSHFSLMKMHDYSCSTIQEKGETFYSVCGFYEHLGVDLEVEILKRAKSGTFFSANELVLMTDNILSALVYLKGFKMVHSDLRPKYISVPDKDSPVFKLLDKLGESISPNKVQMMNFKKGKNLYLSPCLFEAIANRKSKIRHNPYKSDAFSYGLVLLEAGLLKPVQSIYNKHQGIINTKELAKFQDEFAARYFDSENLKQVLFYLLNVDEQARKEPKEILKLITSQDCQSYDCSKDFRLSESGKDSSNILKSESAKIFSDQSVQCEREDIKREESSLHYLEKGLLQAKKLAFLKQEEPMIIVANSKKEDLDSLKITSVNECQETSNFHQKQMISDQKNVENFAFLKIQESNENEVQNDLSYSFRNSLKNEGNKTSVAGLFNLNDEVDKKEFLQTVEFDSKRTPLNLDNSNFLTNNSVKQNRPTDDSFKSIAYIPKSEFITETSAFQNCEVSNSPFYQSKNKEKEESERVLATNETREVIKEAQIRVANDLSPYKYRFCTENSHSKNQIFEKSNEKVKFKTNNIVIRFENDSLKTTESKSARECSPNRPKYDSFNQQRYLSPTIVRKDFKKDEIKAMVFINHDSQMDKNQIVNKTNVEVKRNENFSSNVPIQSFYSNRLSGISDNQLVVQKEIYLSPINYKKLQNENQLVSDLTVFTEDTRDVQVYNYEIQHDGDQHRKYIFKRNASQSILKTPNQRLSVNESRKSSFHESFLGRIANDSGSLANEIVREPSIFKGETEDFERSKNPNYKVYRIERERDNLSPTYLRSKSSNLIRNFGNQQNRNFVKNDCQTLKIET